MRRIKRKLYRIKPLAKGALFGALVVFASNSAWYVPMVQFVPPYTVQFKLVPNTITMTAEAMK